MNNTRTLMASGINRVFRAETVSVVPSLQGDAKKATIGANYASILGCRSISRLSPSRAWAVAAPARRIFARAGNRAADGAASRHVDAGAEASGRRWAADAR